MILADIILVIFLLGFIWNGWRRGAIATLGHLVGIVVAFLVARTSYLFVASLAGSLLPGTSAWGRTVSFILIFLLVNQLCRFLFSLLDAVFNILTIIPFLSTINKLLGALLGIAVGITFIGGAVYAAIFLHVDDRWVGWLTHSEVGRYAEMIFYRVLGFLL